MRTTSRPRLLPALALLVLAACPPCARRAGAGEPPPAASDPTDGGPLARLAPWLVHEDWSMRSLAAFDLRRRTEPEVVRWATKGLRVARHPYADALLLEALDGRPREELVREGGADLAETLIARVDDPHPRVREGARRVAARMPPLQVPPEAERLRAWWARGRNALEVEHTRLVAEHARALAEAAAREKPPAAGAANSVETTTFDDDFYEYMARARRDGLELVIVLDHTGSMASVIGAAKAQARRLVERLRGYVPGFRAGLVTYDDAPRLRLPLTTDPEAVEKAFRRVGAGGGGDYEEGVDKGLFMALRQEQLGWSRRAQRVCVVLGDAPPHDADVVRLLRVLQDARMDPMFDHPLIVHTVSSADAPVPYFDQIARAGGGRATELRGAGRLVEELVALTFGARDRKHLAAWMEAIDALREEDPEPAPR
ncbi:MAG: VWA domain-containing protein [Planctomycetota bacterium]